MPDLSSATTRPRSIRQPGPPIAERIEAVPAFGLPIDRELPAGAGLLDALAALLRDTGCDSACLTLTGGAFGPFAYVMPAASPDASHAAFYSAAFRPPGASRLDAASVTLGWRDAAPFLHCHALWEEADGRPGCGHVLPDETFVAAPIRVQGLGLTGARFEQRQDPETGFRLFSPHRSDTPPPSGGRPAVAVRLAPNQDLTAALEIAGRRAGFRRGLLHGGVASLIGAEFADAAPVEGFATEMLLRAGTLRCAPAAGEPTALDAVLVDLHGRIGAGRLLPGVNPVLMTFEGAIEGQ